MKGQVMTIYLHMRHPRTAARRADRPVKVADQLRRDPAAAKIGLDPVPVIDDPPLGRAADPDPEC